MDKKKAISIITKAAKLYHENLEDQKVLFIYGIPAIIKNEINQNNELISSLSFYEVVEPSGLVTPVSDGFYFFVK